METRGENGKGPKQHLKQLSSYIIFEMHEIVNHRPQKNKTQNAIEECAEIKSVKNQKVTEEMQK